MLGKMRAGEGGSREQGDCLASPAQWIWVWGNCGDREGQGILAYFSSWGHKEMDMI